MNSKLIFLLFLVVGSLCNAQPVEHADNPKNTYLIGLSDNPPISFLNQNNQVEGLIVDLMNEIAKKENFKIEWVFDEWDVLLKKIENSELDMLTSVGFSIERTSYMDFSKEGFISSWSSIYLPKNSAIDNFLDLENKTIAVLVGDINGINLIKRCEQFEINCKFIYVKTYTQLFEKIANNEADAVVSNNIAGIWYANKFHIINSSIIFDPSLTLVSVPQGSSPYLLNLFDKYIHEWKANPKSTYYDIKSKWLTLRANSGVSDQMLYTIFGLAFFGLLTLLTAMIFKYEVKKRIKELSIRNEQFSQIINLVPHVIYVAEENGNILLANKKASQYFGMTSEEIERCKIDNLKTNNSKGISFLNDNNLSKNLKETQLKEIKTSDYLDNEYTLLLSKMPFKLTSKEPMANVTVAVDITDIKKYEQKIMHMAHYDLLTNLPNKALFETQIYDSLVDHKSNQSNGALLYLDLDSFKDINDSQGHRIGDLLIKSVAQRFAELIDSDKTISHFGGDEFVFNLRNLDNNITVTQEIATEFGEFVLSEIAMPYVIEDRVFQITASIGVVLYPSDGNTVETLLQRADTALNQAKKLGRNRMQFFDEDLELSAKTNHDLETELRIAVEKSQLNIVYQPIVYGIQGEIIGAEALLRWNHPEKGNISPIQFIEIAEKIHLIVKMGNWVFEKACQRIRDNIDEGYGEFFIAVNVSVVQLKDVNFYENLSYLIKNYKIPPGYLEIEITESIIMDDVDLAIKIFNQLRLLGVRISIDDFGTGYSSFSYLIKSPIDKIKIDQSFVKNLPLDKNSVTIVKTIIKLAKDLNVSVLAEGVENNQQLEFLQSEGCNYFQGYLFHKPMSYEKLLELKS